MRNGSVDGTVRRILDTNILIYWYDPGDASKQERAHEVIRQAGTVYGTGLTSQVLAEFASVATRPRRPILSPSETSRQIQYLVRDFAVLPVTPPCVVEALRGVATHQLSFWDALLWAVAHLNQASVILTEDLPGGRTSVEGVRYANPLDPAFDIGRIGLDL